MTIKPLGDKILLRILGEAAPKPGGIVMPSATRKSYREAVVQAVGPRYKGEVEPGHTVYHVPFTGTERMINHERYVFVQESDLLGIME